MKKVLIPTKLNKIAAEVLTENGNYTVVQDDSSNLAELAANHADTYALIVRSEKITAGVIDTFPLLKVIVRAGAGFNTIDVEYARKKNIDVMNTPGANSNAVAEEVVALMLSDARHVIPADISTRGGKWEKKDFMGREIAGKTIGILGLGNIGRLVARRLSGFDVTLLGHDPVISAERAREIDVQLVDIKTLFAESDYVTLHAPENDETRGMINKDLLSLMKNGSTVINCARAGIVDEDAFRTLKDSKGLRLLNDVYDKDAEGKKSVADIADIMLPHLGANTTEANHKAATRAAKQLIDLDYKGVTSFIVNRNIPEGLDGAYCKLANTLARLARCLVGKETSLKLIETSFYGALEPFADWLVVPIVAGIWEEFEPSMDCMAARKFLDEMGIEYVNRPTNPQKGFDASITVDLISEVNPGKMRRMSIRGTVAEGIQMVSRINEFNKLFFEPIGHTMFFLYDDRPGILGTIGVELADAGINIEDVRNPHDPKTNRSLAMMRISQQAPDELTDHISTEIQAIAAFSIKL
ncbi:MAG: hypothetical protein KAH23_00845 [Kiritimatiellae bacterium]|nr:hypothetical protein [Kiritimatiellia bacterium]